MNCFSFLNLPENHRPLGKVVQLVKNVGEVPAKKLAWPVIAQRKEDGVYCMIIVQGRATGSVGGAFGRTGKELQTLSWLVQYMQGYIDAGEAESGVFIGELINPRMSLEELSGVVNPNRKSELSTEMQDLHGYTELKLHDYLTLDAFIDGFSQRDYLDRYRALLSFGLIEMMIPCSEVHSMEEFEDFAEHHIALGSEGAVLKQDCDWLAGHKGYRAVKRVRQVSYDLLCIGIEDGQGKREGIAANLFFQWRDGKTLKADLGKGWTDGKRAVLWDNRHDSLLSPVGQVYRVYGLQDSSKGVIRLPKVGEVRHDKNVPDY